MYICIKTLSSLFSVSNEMGCKHGVKSGSFLRKKEAWDFFREFFPKFGQSRCSPKNLWDPEKFL